MYQAWCPASHLLTMMNGSLCSLMNSRRLLFIFCFIKRSIDPRSWQSVLLRLRGAGELDSESSGLQQRRVRQRTKCFPESCHWRSEVLRHLMIIDTSTSFDLSLISSFPVPKMLQSCLISTSLSVCLNSRWVRISVLDWNATSEFSGWLDRKNKHFYEGNCNFSTSTIHLCSWIFYSLNFHKFTFYNQVLIMHQLKMLI